MGKKKARKWVSTYGAADKADAEKSAKEDADKDQAYLDSEDRAYCEKWMKSQRDK
jgi:hypothetical protein